MRKRDKGMRENERHREREIVRKKKTDERINKRMRERNEKRGE